MTLLKWALICLLISLVAGAFGYTGLARGACQLAKILFFIFLVIFIIVLAISPASSYSDRLALAVRRRRRAPEAVAHPAQRLADAVLGGESMCHTR